MLGDTRFFQGCRDYLSDPLLAYKSATTADLQRNMENQLFGVDLTPFFNAWVNGSGTPSYTGNYYISGKTIQFRLTQTRNPVGNPFMPMPVVIKIANAAGTYDTSVVIYHHSASQLAYAGTWEGIGTIGQDYITYDLSFFPATITVDPDNKTMATGTLTNVGSPLNNNSISLSATKTIAGNQLDLQMAASEPVNKVILLKSENGTDFIEAGLMNRVNNQPNNYRFTDVLPYPGFTFYRAKVYSGGNVQYSTIIKVQEKINNTITISPNPATDVVNVSFTNNAASGKVIVRVVNPEGKVVIESATNNSFIHFDISNLPAGIYLAQAVQNGQIFAANKFLVHH